MTYFFFGYNIKDPKKEKEKEKEKETEKEKEKKKKKNPIEISNASLYRMLIICT